MSDIAKSLSEFVAKIAATISITSWVPSATFVVGCCSVANLRNAEPPTLISAVTAFTTYTGRDYALLVAAIFAFTLVLQPLQFSFVRILEGYWGYLWPITWIAALGKAWQLERQRYLLRSVAALKDAEPKPTFSQRLGLTLQLNRLKRLPLIRSIPKGQARTKAEKSALEKNLFPHDLNRLLPTALGNRMRSAEDRSTAADGTPIQTLLLRRFDSLPGALKNQHDTFRTQLELYAQLTFIWTALGVISFSCLNAQQFQAQLALIAFGCAIFSYSACNRAAEGYGATLLAVKDYCDNYRVIQPSTKSATEIDLAGSEKEPAPSAV